MSRRQHGNVYPVPVRKATSDDDDVNDGKDQRSTELDVSTPYGLGPHTVLSRRASSSDDHSLDLSWDDSEALFSLLLPTSTIASTTAATQGSKALFSPLLSISTRSSFHDDVSFGISTEALCELFKKRDLKLLEHYGGIDGIARCLGSHCTLGLVETSPTNTARRTAAFGSNRIPERKPKTLWVCTQESLRDPFAWIFLLINGLSMTVSFLEGGNWIEGTPGVLLLAGVIAWGIAMTWKLDREFARTLKRTTDRQVKVVRGGSIHFMRSHDIMVGDIICLEQGDCVLADGLLISGRGIKCDESCLNGESELVSKAEAPRGGESDASALESLLDAGHCDPFIISGSSIVEGGPGRCLVTGVGVNSTNGRLMQHVRMAGMEVQTPLQERVVSLTGSLSSLAIGVVTLFFIAILARSSPGGINLKHFLMALRMAVIMVVVSVPEGLPMSVTTALVSAWQRGMRRNKMFARRLAACETMGNATAICCDKTGTLTTNEMEVAAGMIGITGRFSEETGNLHWQEVCPDLRDLFVKSATINSTALEIEENGKHTFRGSGTETALLRFAKSRFGIWPIREARDRARVVESIPFDSRKKCMATVTRVSDELYRVYVKGAPEILLKNSDRTIQGPDDLTEIPITREHVLRFTHVIDEDGSKSLRMLGLAYRDFSTWPPPALNTRNELDAREILNHVLQGLVFFGLVGIHDPLRPGVRETVAKCQGAGIAVRLVTGDSSVTAAAVARECGILGTGDQAGAVMEGLEFTNLLPDKMRSVLPRLRVLARSTPENKKLIVSKLKELGETVAVTGDGTNDGPALRAADVGISLGKSGADVAKEASSIVLLDDDLASILDVIASGRSVYDAVRRFLQFQLTANLSVLALTATFAIRDGIEATIFTVHEMLWINLIMDLFAALALSTDGPDRQILNRPPEKRTACLVSFANYKMIISQAAYQFIVVMFIMSSGHHLVTLLDPSIQVVEDFNDSREIRARLRTLASNTYIFMLLFNLFNCRSATNNINILKGVHKNKVFIGTAVCIVSIQVLWISFGGGWLQVTRLNWASWAFAAGVGSATIPLGMAIRCFPDARFVAFGGRTTSKTAAATKDALVQFFFRLVELTFDTEKTWLDLARRVVLLVSRIWTPRRLRPWVRALRNIEDIPDEQAPLLGYENV